MAFALVAAAAWAAYILLSAATGRRFSGSSGLVLAMGVAALAVTPAALAAARGALARPGILATGAAIGLLSSVVPYRFELEALRRIPAGVFGIWMSLEPAVAALIGLVLLGQALGAAQWAAVACVMVACAGAARGAAARAAPARAAGRPGLPRPDPRPPEPPGAARARMRSRRFRRRRPVFPGRNRADRPPGVPARAVRSYDGCVPANTAASGAAAAPRPVGRSMARRCADVLLAPSPLVMRRIALAGVLAAVGIMLTGAGVRLSQSGLGCPDWPRCTATSLVAGGRPGIPSSTGGSSSATGWSAWRSSWRPWRCG